MLPNVQGGKNQNNLNYTHIKKSMKTVENKF
jgi:hypothetical protein